MQVVSCPSDIISIILGKLPTNEQYKRLYFSKKTKAHFDQQGLLKMFLLCKPTSQVYLSLAPIFGIQTIDENSRTYEAIGRIIWLNKKEGKTVFRYVEGERIVYLFWLKLILYLNSPDQLLYLFESRGILECFYETSLPRKLAEVFLLYAYQVKQQQSIHVIWKGIPPFLIPYPDLIDQWKSLEMHICGRYYDSTLPCHCMRFDDFLQRMKRLIKTVSLCSVYVIGVVPNDYSHFIHSLPLIDVRENILRNIDDIHMVPFFLKDIRQDISEFIFELWLANPNLLKNICSEDKTNIVRVLDRYNTTYGPKLLSRIEQDYSKWPSIFRQILSMLS